MCITTVFQTMVNAWKFCHDLTKEEYDFNAAPKYKYHQKMFVRLKGCGIPDDDLVKAYKLLCDDCDHQWILNSAFIESRDIALKIIAVDRLWDVTFEPLTFETIYCYVESLLIVDGKPIKGIGQLTLYDISMRIVARHGWTCWPTKVYLHAIPGRVSKRILDIYEKGTKHKCLDIIDPSHYSSLFPTLSPKDIETILCEIGKAIRHYEKEKCARVGDWNKFDIEVIDLLKKGLI